MESGQINTSAGIPLTSELGQPASTVFKYEQLDRAIDCIRLLVLLPGTKDDDIACELIHRTFASKPKFEALSYTWGEASNLKSIHLNNSPFGIRETLYHALFNLRSKTEKRFIWADAICIDQNNVEERSNQVRLMPFIYSRAQAVVVWLGIPVPTFYNDSRTQFRREYLETICNHPYWRRVWIIQEVSLARDIVIGFSGATFSWAELRVPFRRIKDGSSSMVELYDPVEKVLEQRENRHDAKNRLELLLERFSKAQCGEVRDKIYGFIGLAHDCHDGSIKIDYSASLYDIFADVVKFQHAAKPLQGPFYRPWSTPIHVDRPARLVRFAQLVQRAFNGAIDITARNRMTKEDLLQLFHAKGYIAGTILHLGTSYQEFLSSFAAERQWKLSWNEHYTGIADLKTLREMDDVYTKKLLEMGEIDQARIQQIHNESSFGFQEKPGKNGKGPTSQNENENASNPQTPTSQAKTDFSDEPRRFLGSSFAFGFVPPAAREGDLICRFWDCDVAIVLRQQGTDNHFDIIGQADVADLPQDRVVFKGDGMTVVEHAISLFESYHAPKYDSMDLYLDLETLQRITG